MFRSIRNISIAIFVIVLIAWFWFVSAIEQWQFKVSDFLLLLFWLIVVVVLLAAIAWALGLTRFSAVHVRQRSTVILNYLEQAVRMNLPLSRLLLAAQASEPRWTGDQIGRLREQLNNGASVADALRKSVTGITDRNLSLIATAERLGQLGPELTRRVQDAQNRQTHSLADRTFLRSYPVAMFISIFLIFSLIMIFVMPKFEQIFHDFHAQLPPITQSVVNFANLLDPASWVGLILGLAVLAVIVQTTRRRWNWFSPDRWFNFNRDLGDVCHVIGEALSANLPLDLAIQNASDLSIGHTTRNKLRKWSNGIQNGLTSTDAAFAAGIPLLIARLTTTAEGFEFLSRYYAGKHSRLLILVRAATIPAMVFFFGIIVAILALALFLPLVGLIDSVSPGSSAHTSWL